MGYVETGSHEEDANLAALEIAGVAERINKSGSLQRWQLSAIGMHNLLPVVLYNNTRPLFRLRPGLALEDRTTYELTKMLELDGFQLARWIPQSQRTKRTPFIPIGFYPDSPKVYYTTPKEVSQKYLMCLISAEVFFRAGLDKVPIIVTKSIMARFLHIISHGLTRMAQPPLLTLTKQVYFDCRTAHHVGMMILMVVGLKHWTKRC